MFYCVLQLYELYLGNQLGFESQLLVDLCICWQDSINDFVCVYCVVVGILVDYFVLGNLLVQIFMGGGKGFFKLEIFCVKIVGLVWMLMFVNFSLVVDYFDYKIEGEISMFSVFDIVIGCYVLLVYLNNFCSLFECNFGIGGEVFKIINIYVMFININSQCQCGYDFQVDFDQDFLFGIICVGVQVVKMIFDVMQLFSMVEVSGFENFDCIGYIGSLQWIVLLNVSYKWGDWMVIWQGKYVSVMCNKDIFDIFMYQGYFNVCCDIKVDV